MQRLILTYNALPLNADSTPAGDQVPILNSDGSLTLTGAGVISTYGKFSKTLYLTGDLNVTTTATIDDTYALIRLDTTAGAFTATLPAAATVDGLVLIFKRITATANLPTIKGSGSELIDGANTYTGLSAQYKAVWLRSNGTTWDIIAAF